MILSEAHSILSANTLRAGHILLDVTINDHTVICCLYTKSNQGITSDYRLEKPHSDAENLGSDVLTLFLDAYPSPERSFHTFKIYEDTLRGPEGAGQRYCEYKQGAAFTFWENDEEKTSIHPAITADKLKHYCTTADDYIQDCIGCIRAVSSYR